MRQFKEITFTIILLSAAIVLGPQIARAQEKMGSDSDNVSIDTAVALVNGKPITFHDLTLAEDELFSVVGQMPNRQRMEALVGYIVNRELASEAAKAMGIRLEDPEVMKRMAFYTKKALQEVYMGRVLADRVSPADARAYYDKEVAGAAPVEEVRARHILVADEALARDVAQQAKKDGADFEALAKKHSTGPSGASGGDLGYFTADQMVGEFSAAAFKLKVGGVSDPVKTQFGWHIIKLEDRRARPVPPFEAIEGQITEFLIGEAQRALYDELREKATVELVLDNGAALSPDAVGTPKGKPYRRP